jgi:hypothetical protein
MSTLKILPRKQFCGPKSNSDGILQHNGNFVRPGFKATKALYKNQRDILWRQLSFRKKANLAESVYRTHKQNIERGIEILNEQWENIKIHYQIVERSGSRFKPYEDNRFDKKLRVAVEDAFDKISRVIDEDANFDEQLRAAAEAGLARVCRVVDEAVDGAVSQSEEAILNQKVVDAAQPEPEPQPGPEPGPEPESEEGLMEPEPESQARMPGEVSVIDADDYL